MNTFKIELELPCEVSFKRCGHAVTYRLDNKPAAILAMLAEHGLIQKVGDAGAGKDETEGLAKMNQTDDTLVKGDWGVKRGASDGMSGMEKAAFQLYVDAQPWGKKVKADDKRAQTQPRWDAMADADKQVWLDEARDEADRAKAAEERRARLAATLNIKV